MSDDEASRQFRGTGIIGVRDTRDLGDYAERIRDIGRASHSPFGDAIVTVAERLIALAHEARRRLAEDRLPDDAGTPERRERRSEDGEAPA